jgi:hypothetical protein
MDITNNITNLNDKNTENDEDITNSSDYEISTTDTTINLSDESINELLGGSSDSKINYNSLEISDLLKNPNFNQLTNNQKSLIINKINEKNNINNLVKSSDEIINKDCYFYCKTCGYYEIIPNRMFIFSRGDAKKDVIYNFNLSEFKNDCTLPSTKKYNCINDKCDTHKNPQLKNAKFYRQKSSYCTKYICNVCDSYWNTFIEK